MKRLLLVAVCACLCATSAWANDIIEWGQLGDAGAILHSPQSWTSQSGQYTGIVGNTTDQIFQRVDEGNGWSGNFTTGDHLIWTQAWPNQRGGQIFLRFDQLVYGGEAQIEPTSSGEFYASIIAFGDDNMMLNEIDVMGFSGPGTNGASILLSFLSDQPNVRLIEFDVYDPIGSASFAMDKFTIYAVTPEPSSLILAGSGLLGALGYIRRRTTL